jgi:hypothetical protein
LVVGHRSCLRMSYAPGRLISAIPRAKSSSGRQPRSRTAR